MNAISKAEEGDILFTSTMDNLHLAETNQGMSNEWVLESGASFHASPNCVTGLPTIMQGGQVVSDLAMG